MGGVDGPESISESQIDAVLMGPASTRIVRASKIDAQRMWLKGVSPEALR